MSELVDSTTAPVRLYTQPWRNYQRSRRQAILKAELRLIQEEFDLNRRQHATASKCLGCLTNLPVGESASSSGSDQGRENLSINQATGRKLYWIF